ncbi:MAG: hypothetical protein AB2A00_08190 [Myxococcota bacterium]
MSARKPWILLVLASSSWAHAAQTDACGGIRLAQGTVQLGRPLGMEGASSPEDKACLAAVAQELARHEEVRGITVAVRVPDAQRAEGKALATARRIADELVTAGLPKERVFAVAPRAEDYEPPTIQIRYTERAPQNVVARVATVDGSVQLGPDEATLRPAEMGMPVQEGALVQTGIQGAVWLRLKDGSGFKLGPRGLMKVVQLQHGDDGVWHVRLELVRGELETSVKNAAAGSELEASTRVAVARGRSSFRLVVQEDGGARVESLDGRVTLGSRTRPDAQPVEVAAGQGARVGASGRMESPGALPRAPAPVGPLKGALPANHQLSWAPVDGAVRYRVELAQDADFTARLGTRLVDRATVHTLEPVPAAGKWFWRVSAVDDAGFVGPASKVHAFVVVP